MERKKWGDASKAEPARNRQWESEECGVELFLAFSFGPGTLHVLIFGRPHKLLVGCVFPLSLRFICPVLLVCRAGRLLHNYTHSMRLANGSDLTAHASVSSPRFPLFFAVRNLLLPRICCLNLFVLCRFWPVRATLLVTFRPGSCPSSIEQKKSKKLLDACPQKHALSRAVTQPGMVFSLPGSAKDG